MTHLGLFSGIGGFEEAFRRAGVRLSTVCEIDSKCQSVLRRHFPEVEIIFNVKEVSKEKHPMRPDVITGGFPCQDLSVAGRRAGLDGERSGLWFEMLRVITEYQPRWVVIENVPGLLSSNGGRDFAIILSGLVKCGYGVCWRIFDAQYFGLAQRRQRVFIVASRASGKCAEILFEREGGAWDSPPSREAGKDIASTIRSGAAMRSAGAGQTANGMPGNLVSGTLAASGAGTERTAGQCNELDFLVPFGLIGNGEYAKRPATIRANGGDCGGGSEHLIAFGGNNTTGPIDVATACNAHGGTGRLDYESETFIAHTLRGEGFDASEDGTGRGTPIVVAPELSIPLTASGRGTERIGESRGQDTVIAFTERSRLEGRTFEAQEDLSYSLTDSSKGGNPHSGKIAGGFGVRRLMPVECEILQGFPKGWTETGIDEKGNEIALSDSARYRMLGNAVAVPIVEWIARRIVSME